MRVDVSIANRIAAVGDKNPRRRNLEDIERLMFHRIDVGENATRIAEWFRENASKVSIPFMPYTLTVDPRGLIEQALPLQTIAPHALKWNVDAISVGVIGDFRKRNPTLRQIVSCRFLNRLLGQAFLRWWPTVGHTRVHSTAKPSTSNPKKECPGKYFGIEDLNTLTIVDLQTEARALLKQVGLVF